MPLNKCYTTQGSNFNLERQIRNHVNIYNRIAIRLKGFENAREYLNKCLYYVQERLHIYNYFPPQFYPTSRIFNSGQHAQNLKMELFT